MRNFIYVKQNLKSRYQKFGLRIQLKFLVRFVDHLSRVG